MGAFADTAAATADAALVAAARDGQQSAFAELFERYQQRIYNYAYGIAGNHEDAGDIAQDAFVRVFQALPRLTGELNFSAYLYRTAHNTAIDAVKHRTRFVAPDLLDLQMEPALRADPERVTLLREQQEQTWQATFELSDNHRAILALRELHDLSYQEIADVMGMKRATVGALLSRARLKFKEAFRMSSIDTENLVKECRDMLPLLSAYLDDELDAPERDHVGTHLEACAFCGLALEEMTESSRSYRALAPIALPLAFRDSAWASVRERLTTDAASRATAAAGAADATGAPESADAWVSGGALPPANGGAPEAPRGRVSRVVAGVLVTAAVVFFGVSMAGGIAAYRAYQASTTTTVAASTVNVADGQSDVGVLASDDDRSTSTVAPGSSEPTVIRTSTTDPSTTDPPATRAPTTRPSTTRTTAALSTTPVTSAATTTSVTRTIGTVTSTTRPTLTLDTTPPPTPALISPSNGAVIESRTLKLVWQAVKDPSGVLYRVEVQRFDGKTYVPAQTYTDLTVTSVGRTMAASAERWRVSAVDGRGNWSTPSRWWSVSRQLVIVVPMTMLTTTTFMLY